MINKPETEKICPGCGMPVPAHLGLCPSCMLGDQLMNTSENQTLDYASRPLIENQEQDLSIDNSGQARWVEPLVPGSRIGQFEIVKRLGRGGMGTVYEAHDIENQRRVALKVLSRPVDHQEARQRFLREGRLAASINHPNSVFVFGTHQIDQLSLISMELVDGGTLEQQVRRNGPMKSRDAVDAALQIIDGLQAAYTLGVLHRDIKPANCFQGMDGTIKIGDFGLSISIDVQPNSRITTEGLFLGTPAFSSPEQLRGDALDVRSDIYAFGVTLYYLLTGQTPFKADGMVKLLALVLESSPPAAHAIRPDIPVELSRIVMRCLSKEPGDRFLNYKELRVALMRFSSTLAVPALLGPRAIAGLIDYAVLIGASFLYSSNLLFLPIDPTKNYASHIAYMVYLVVGVVYFATCEATFGQTIGKRVIGLHTVDAEGHRPSVSLALKRAIIFMIVPVFFAVPFNLVSELPNTLLPKMNEWLLFVMAEATPWFLWALLFCNLRQKNGQSVLLDFVSGTRVVSKPPEYRGAMDVSRTIAPNFVGNKKAIGPYFILDSLPMADASDMFVGYDTILLRRVWLKQNDDPASNDTPRYQSSLSRATRLRWLNQVKADGHRWDVYEAPDGQPFGNLLLQPTQWQDIRFCLADLSKEIDTALQTDTVPMNLGLDHLWVTDSGHIKLLDFTAPQMAVTRFESTEIKMEDSPTSRKTPEQRASHFLEVLANQVEKSLIPRKRSSLPPPLRASQMLVTLRSDCELGSKLQAVRDAAAFHEMEPRKRRLLMAISFYAAPLLVLAFMAAFQINTWLFFANNPDIAELYSVGSVLVETAEQAGTEPRDYDLHRRHRAAEAIVASEMIEVLKDPRLESISLITSIDWSMRSELDAAAVSARPSAEEVSAAKELLADELKKRVAQVVSFGSLSICFPLQMSISVWWAYVGVPATIGAILFRGGLVMHGFQVAVVRMNGKRVGRLGLFVRSLFPHVLGIAAYTCVTPVVVHPHSGNPSQMLNPTLMYVATASVVLSVLVSNFVGLRSLTDRILGTAVVSK